MIFLVYSIVSLFNCMVVLFPALRDIHCTSMARYSLFVLKVPLNNNKPKPNLSRYVTAKVKVTLQLVDGRDRLRNTGYYVIPGGTVS